MSQVSTREYEILELIAKGYSTKDISKMLFISEETVKSHRKNLRNKFSAKNTPNLINLAFKNGVLNT